MATVPGTPPQQPGPGSPPAEPPASVPVYQQPVAPAAATTYAAAEHPKEKLELIIYSHSNFFYWWPVWVVGFIMAALSRSRGS